MGGVRIDGARRGAVAAAVLLLIAACGSSSGAADPYLWLEDWDSPRVQAWVAAENSKTLGVLERDPRHAENLAQAIELGNAPDRLPEPEFQGGMVGNFWRDAEHERGIWRETTITDYETPQPNWSTLLDLDALARAENRNWVWKGASCSPVTRTRCLVFLSEGGEDAVTVREFDRAARGFVAGGFELERGKQFVSWTGDDALLVSREWATGEKTASGYPYVVKRWERGQPLERAVEVLRGDPADGLGTEPVLLDGGKKRLLNLVVRHSSFYQAEFDLVTDDRTVRLALPPDADIKGILGDRVLVSLRQDWTTDGTTFASGSLVSLDADEMISAPDRLRATVVYAPGPRETLRSVLTTRDRLIVTSLHDVRGRAAIYTPEPGGAWSAAPIPLPDNATVEAVAADGRGTTAYLSVTSFLTPTALWRIDTADGRLDMVKNEPAQFDSSRFVVDQLETASPDGTQVPYFIVRGAGMPYDGTNPTILYGYGGFNAAVTPTYDGLLGRLWLERGGVYVIANIRGGGEYGPAWHEAALKTNRQRAFDDFVAVADDLIIRNITTPRHLGIQGGSNGGLLVGVAMTQRPALWNAVDIQVPLLDMVRYEQIAAGASWVGEYGSAANPEERRFLESISPYAQLREGVHYPEAFVWTTTRDDRVGPQHARKFAAKLSDLGNPYLFYEATQGGHGAGANIDEEARTAALEYTYFMRQLLPEQPR
ncbi:prolyl oligopeptidase family serine peptidase [Nocardia sp. IFM 10818]